MDSGTNMPRLYLFLLRILQCFGSLTIIIIEILRHTNVIYPIESRMDVVENEYELFFEYCVMNLAFVTSALYIFRFNQRWKQGPYKYDILIDCVLMNAWMIFGILRLSPEFDDSNVLNCSQYPPKQHKGCVTYISTLVLGYATSASYFFTAIISTWLWTRKGSEVNTNPNNLTNNNTDDINVTINNTDNTNNPSSVKISSNQTKLNESKETKNTVTQDGEIRNSGSISSNEFTSNNQNLSHLSNEDSEFNRTDGSILILCKPSPHFLKHETPPSHHSSLDENSINSKCISEYSLDSSFSKTYGPIIIPRKYTTYSESTASTNSKYDGSVIADRNHPISTYSEASSLSDITSRSSRYDGSIIIKLVT
uniref:MARVEL domain-containing protein n=1 Tax=Anthurium amnicola TaxID=1678845 RepID=A0A1D1XCE8_9ARAE